MKRDFLTVANLLSLIRLLLAVPFAVVMLSPLPDARVWGTIILVAAALTDKLDGMLARSMHQESEWGRILDPVADKVGIACGAVVLLLLGDMPLWFVVLVLGRDALILAGGLLLKARRGIVVPSNTVGKWTVGALALLTFLLVVGVHGPVTDVILFATAAMLVLSLVLYVRVFISTLAAERRTQ